jgi:hypothetical protein
MLGEEELLHIPPPLNVDKFLLKVLLTMFWGRILITHSATGTRSAISAKGAVVNAWRGKKYDTFRHQDYVKNSDR